MTALPFGARALMASRVEPPDSLEYFPTPPWATRALMVHVLGKIHSPLSHCGWTALDPACGEGHMVEPLREYFGHVFGADIHDYGAGYPVVDFLDRSRDVPAVDFVITNPPFSAAVDFVARCLDSAVKRGVAIFQRLSWWESEGRYRDLFGPRPPHVVAPFVERVPLVKGRWDPAASTATSYAWFVWLFGLPYGETRARLIPPCKAKLHRQSDIERWCPPAPLPLFDGVANG